MNRTAERVWMGISIVLLAVLVVVVWLNPFAKEGKQAADGSAVAKVNGVEITKDALYDELFAQGGPQTLNKLIDMELIRQAAEKANVTVTDSDVEKEMDTIKQSFGSDEEFEYALLSYGMSLDALKAEMQIQVQLRKLLEPQLTITDEDVKAYYDQNIEYMKTPEQVRASHILVDTKEEAESILTQLKSGADFAELAKEKSKDPGSAANGGDLNYFGRGEMQEPFEKAAFELPVGELSELVETTYGFHIIKVTDHKQAESPTFDEKKEELREAVLQGKIQELSQTWLEEQRKSADIQQF